MDKTLGKCLVVEMLGCSVSAIDDVGVVEKAMRDAAQASGMHIVTGCFHRFSPQGVSGVLVIEESHIAIHAWPELGYASVDVFTCGNEGSPEKAVEHLARTFGAKIVHTLGLDRGLHLPKIVRQDTIHPPG